MLLAKLSLLTVDASDDDCKEDSDDTDYEGCQNAWRLYSRNEDDVGATNQGEESRTAIGRGIDEGLSRHLGGCDHYEWTLETWYSGAEKKFRLYELLLLLMRKLITMLSALGDIPYLCLTTPKMRSGYHTTILDI